MTVTRYIQNVHHWHEHKLTSVLAIGQLHHRSVTARGLATHAADAVAAHQSKLFTCGGHSFQFPDA